MSAHVLTDSHFAAIVGTILARGNGRVSPACTEIANMLGRENEASVAARYNETPNEVNIDPRLVGYFAANPLTNGEFVNALDCYAYQSCEHRGWESSESCAYYRAALVMAGAHEKNAPIRQTTAYKDAPWGVANVDLGPIVDGDDDNNEAPEARPSTGSALADIVISVEDHGDESAALAALAISHRGLMRKALIALGTHTKSEARRVKRPEAERLIGAAIVRAALAHELASMAA